MKPIELTLLLFATILIFPTFVYSQEKFKARVVDSKSKKGINNVYWKIIDSDLEGYTNKSGKFSFKYAGQPNIHLGHREYHLDTIINYKSEEIISLRRISPEDIIPVISDYEKGQMQDGYKVGVWEYYDTPDTLALKIDYDQGSLLYVKKDTSIHVIEKDGQWVETKLDVAPRYIGSHTNLSLAITQHRAILPQVMKTKKSANFYISFEVDLSGQATNFTIHEEKHTKYGQGILTAIEQTPNLWIVAQKDNIKYKSRLIFPVELDVQMDNKRSKPGYIPNQEKIPNGKRMRPLVIKLRGQQRTSPSRTGTIRRTISKVR